MTKTTRSEELKALLKKGPNGIKADPNKISKSDLPVFLEEIRTVADDYLKARKPLSVEDQKSLRKFLHLWANCAEYASLKRLPKKKVRK
jgi:hypothetical protein